MWPLKSFLPFLALSLQMGDSQQSPQAYPIEQQQVRVASYPELKFVTDEKNYIKRCNLCFLTIFAFLHRLARLSNPCRQILLWKSGCVWTSGIIRPATMTSWITDLSSRTPVIITVANWSTVTSVSSVKELFPYWQHRDLTGFPSKM